MKRRKRLFLSCRSRSSGRFSKDLPYFWFRSSLPQCPINTKSIIALMWSKRNEKSQWKFVNKNPRAGTHCPTRYYIFTNTFQINDSAEASHIVRCKCFQYPYHKKKREYHGSSTSFDILQIQCRDQQSWMIMVTFEIICL